MTNKKNVKKYKVLNEDGIFRVEGNYYYVEDGILRIVGRRNDEWENVASFKNWSSINIDELSGVEEDKEIYDLTTSQFRYTNLKPGDKVRCLKDLNAREVYGEGNDFTLFLYKE